MVVMMFFTGRIDEEEKTPLLIKYHCTESELQSINKGISNVPLV
jgi:hypothetical protein